VISDTHGLVRPEALDALRGAELILHAGDIGDPSVIDALMTLAPVQSVRGNTDHELWARKLPERFEVQVADTRIVVMHDLHFLANDPREQGWQVVISGHSHRPGQHDRNGVLYFNPGSAGPRRFALPISVGKLWVRAGSVRGEIVLLSAASSD
jgi:putative phosphoesterase